MIREATGNRFDKASVAVPPTVRYGTGKKQPRAVENELNPNAIILGSVREA